MTTPTTPTTPTTARPDDPTARPDPAVVAQVARWWADWVAHRAAALGVPGVQVAVRLDGGLVVSAAAGAATLAGAGVGERPLGTGHLFRVASHSKTFTAVAVLYLVESGALRLDDTVAHWLPELADAENGIGRRTLRHLLSHGGGVVRDGADGDHWTLVRRFPDRARLLAVAAEPSAVVFGADRDFKYSNIGFGLLGLVVEAASGVSYAEFVRTRLLEPLGLADTGPELDADRAGELATGYTARSLGPRVPVEHVDTGALAAATGFWATAADLTAWFSAQLPGDTRLLSDDAKRAMHRQEWAVDDGGYGLGTVIARIGGRELAGHSGGYPGHITRSLLDPGYRIAVSVLTNAVDGPAAELAAAFFTVLALALDRGADVPPVPDGVDPQRFAGRFATLWGAADVAAFGDRLLLLGTDQDDPADHAEPLAVVDAGTLRFTGRSGYGSPGEPVPYTFAADGSVSTVRLGSGNTYVPLSTWRATVGDHVPAPTR